MAPSSIAATRAPAVRGPARPLAGDTLTINTVENNLLPQKSRTARPTVPAVSRPRCRPCLPAGQDLPGNFAVGRTANDFSGKGEAASKNVFTGTITVTVIEVLENGNLWCPAKNRLPSARARSTSASGRQSELHQGHEHDRLVASRMPAIEYKESGGISEAQVMGWLARFFLSFLPF